MQAIAIGPIKYVTHDTMRCDREERVFLLPLLPAVRATFPISSDDRWITEEHLRQSGRADGWTERMGAGGIDLSRRYINSFSVYITARARPPPSNARNQLLWSARRARGYLRCSHFSRRLPPLRRVPFLSSFLFPTPPPFFFCFSIHRTLAKLYYQLLLSKFPTHLATGDAINLKKIINSNFSKTSGGFSLSLSFSLPLSFAKNSYAG